MNVGLWLVFVYDGFLLCKRRLHVYETLVAAASEIEAFVFERLYESTVYKHVYVLQQILLLRFVCVLCVSVYGNFI